MLTSGIGGSPCTPGFAPDDRDSISFTVANVVGLDENSKSFFEIYPNPIQEVLNIKGNLNQIEELKIFSITGTHVFETQIISNKIELSFLSSGIYIMELSTAQSVESYKLIKE